MLCSCSVANISRGVLGTGVNPDMCRVRVDGQIFESGKKKLRIHKYVCIFSNKKFLVAVAIA